DAPRHEISVQQRDLGSGVATPARAARLQARRAELPGARTSGRRGDSRPSPGGAAEERCPARARFSGHEQGLQAEPDDLQRPHRRPANPVDLPVADGRRRLLLTMRLTLPLTKYPKPEPRTALYQRLEERLRGVSAIQASAPTSNPP